jgi:Na+-driven multidrug efflux pump
MLPFAGRRFGERDVAGVRGGLRQAHLAVAGYAALTAPLLYFVAPPLAEHLSSSPVTLGFLIPALRVVPLGAFVATPFFLCRPVFEGMGNGRPGLTMSVLRYLLLAAPAALLGLRLAPAFRLSDVMGLILGLMAATAISSAVFLLWTRKALTAAAKGTQNPPAAA